MIFNEIKWWIFAHHRGGTTFQFYTLYFILLYFTFDRWRPCIMASFILPPNFNFEKKNHDVANIVFAAA